MVTELLALFVENRFRCVGVQRVEREVIALLEERDCLLVIDGCRQAFPGGVRTKRRGGRVGRERIRMSAAALLTDDEEPTSAAGREASRAGLRAVPSELDAVARGRDHCVILLLL